VDAFPSDDALKQQPLGCASRLPTDVLEQIATVAELLHSTAIRLGQGLLYL